MGHIKPVQLAPLRPPFPRWYNAHTQCDYHGGNPGHPTENCTALKYKVRDLVNEGKLRFEDLDGSVEVEDSSRTKEKVPIAKANSSSAIERLKERSDEPNGEEKKKMLQYLVRNLERILNEKNEYITTLRGKHNGQSLKRRWTLRNGDA